MLEIKPKDANAPPQALERTFLAVHSPAVKLPPGTLVKISGWVRIPKAITASADGALLYDSAGGEPLAVRLTQPTQGLEAVHAVPPRAGLGDDPGDAGADGPGQGVLRRREDRAARLLRVADSHGWVRETGRGEVVHVERFAKRKQDPSPPSL